jgi:hypothetical protein
LMEGQVSSHIGGTGLRLSYWRDRPDKRPKWKARENGKGSRTRRGF